MDDEYEDILSNMVSTELTGFAFPTMKVSVFHQLCAFFKVSFAFIRKKKINTGLE